MKLPVYLGLLHKSEQTLVESFRQVAEGHGAEPDVYYLCQSLADQCRLGDILAQDFVSGEDLERIFAAYAADHQRSH